jgi:hypothetical protein
LVKGRLKSTNAVVLTEAINSRILGNSPETIGKWDSRRFPSSEIATDRRAPAWGVISPLNWTELELKTLLAFAADSDE